MHELGLCEDIVAAIEQRAQERPVARVKIRVGRLHHVHPEAFAQSFAMAAAGGVVDGADADLVLLPVTAHCRACGLDTEAEELIYSCSACGSFDVELTGGEELVLESIEYRPSDTGASLTR
jgi:hydrogenase nickel incorporation protein HypA/HybF